MKDIKCPLCGGSFELFEEAISTYLYQCLDCPLASAVSGTKNGALENAEELISKFPPIMRLQVNDIIAYSSRYGQGINNAQVYEIFHDKNVISTSRGYCTPADVFKWPWELEQKGGAEQ